MSINIDKLVRLNELVSLSFRRKHVIVLNPEEKNENEENLSANIIYDKVQWKISDEIQAFVDELSKNNELSNEDKILLIFDKLCKKYVYDDNLISYIQKIDDDAYGLPDWYGRDINQEWEKNREKHNRRICYEISRYYAKALTELFKDNDDFNVCILWDKGHTHYFVGLTCSEYSVTLDLDDFNNIKDLTRLKTGLTAEGITILNDSEGKFASALDRFNDGKSKYAIIKMENEVSNRNMEKQDSSLEEESDDIVFFQQAIEILKEQSDIDSQGLYEYMKEIVDIKLGPEAREKAWKKIEEEGKATRYIRCLILAVGNKKYIIDVDKMILRPFDNEEFEKEDSSFIPYKKLSRDWSEYYDGK